MGVRYVAMNKRQEERGMEGARDGLREPTKGQKWGSSK